MDSKINTGYYLSQAENPGLKSKMVKELPEEVKDYGNLLKEKREELWVKIMNGDTEPTYQIGGQSFTEKEWEKLLQRIDTEIETEEEKKHTKAQGTETQKEKPVNREEIMEMMMSGARQMM